MESRHDYCCSKPGVNKNDCDKVMLNEMKTSNSATLGEKLNKYLIVKTVIYSKYKLGLGAKWSDKLAEELRNPIIKKFPLRRVMVSGPNEIWSADLIDMKEFSKNNKCSTIGKKISKYLIVKPIIYSKYKLGLGTKKPTTIKWSDTLAEELHKPITTKFPLRRAMVSGPNEIWSADLIDMREFSKG